MSALAVEFDVKWYENPNRKCINDYRYTNIPQGNSAQKKIAEMIYQCMNCPVIAACYADAAKYEGTKYPTRDVVQGGQLWR